MGAVEEYRERREARLAEKCKARIDAYKARRDERLKGRLPVEYRSDAPEGNNNQEESGGGGGHGNTRLPFGLCMRYGIAIEPGWGPSDAWAALKGKGITASGAYGKLGEGADPGTPDGGEVPKEPVKTVHVKTYGGEVDYNKLEGVKDRWARRGDPPWRLHGERVEGTYEDKGWRSPPRRMSEGFMTKTDMLRWLKEKGVEEFADPETGEIVNPVEMELPTPVMTVGKTGYSAVSIGFRGGMYGVIGTDYDGKKKTLNTFMTLEEAKSFARSQGAKDEDIKVSPATRKRETERVSWLSSDKKEYIEEGGKRFGDIHIEDSGSRWLVSGEAEDGERFRKRFNTKAEAMAFLKDQGVQKVKEGKEFSDPQEYEVPETIATVRGTPVQEVGLMFTGYGSDYYLYGKDLDGHVFILTYKYGKETHGEFLERVKANYGLDAEQLTIDDEGKKKIKEIEKAEEERERRRKEFEAKSEDFGGSRYMDIRIEKDEDGGYRYVGYDKSGREQWIDGGDWYSMERIAKRNGKDISKYIKDEETRQSYEKYQEKMREFDAKATIIGGEKFADIVIDHDGYGFYMEGVDSRGRKRRIVDGDSYEDFEKNLNDYGYSPTQFQMEKFAEEKKDRAIKAKYLRASGGYYSFGKKDEAFKDIHVEEESNGSMWHIKGTDVDGNEVEIKAVGSWDDAIDEMRKEGVSDYKMKDRSGAEIGRPTYGMSRVTLMRKPGGGFIVFADSDRYGKHAVMYETPFENEARAWLKKNNVPEGGIKTRGMNPNDDAPRTHTAKSLGNFDTHRMEKAEQSKMLSSMDEPTKIETAEMLTEMFDKGAYRMNRRDNFAQIVDHGFKNLLETGTSGGSSYKPGRRETGVETFGHDYDMPASETERYGFWGLDDDMEASSDRTASGYGRIMFKFKKDKVAERSTYTFGDTLDAGRPLAGYAGGKPTIEGVTGLDEYGYGKKSLEDILKTYRKYKSGGMSFSDFHSAVSRACQDGYVECQYHGPLGIEDVDTITFTNSSMRDTFDKMNPTTRKRVVKKLKDNGIVMQYKDGSGLHDVYEWLKNEYGED